MYNSSICWQFLADAKSKHGTIWNLACTNWGQSGILMLLICLTLTYVTHMGDIPRTTKKRNTFFSIWFERLDILSRLNASSVRFVALAPCFLVLSSTVWYQGKIYFHHKWSNVRKTTLFVCVIFCQKWYIFFCLLPSSSIYTQYVLYKKQW